MPIKKTHVTTRANLAKLCEEVAQNGRIVIISRCGKQDVALISADELSALQDTIHLLSSPNNAKRLLNAIDRAKTKSAMPT